MISAELFFDSADIFIYNSSEINVSDNFQQGFRSLLNITANINNRRRSAAMKNVEMSVNGDILTIKVDLSMNFGKSSSGKSTIIASTEGNQAIPGNDNVKIGLNVYTK